MEQSMTEKLSRREFVKSGSALTAATLAGAPMVHAGGQDTITVGVIGCGGRGTGAMENCLDSAPNVRIIAMGDMFPERLKGARKQLADSKREGFKVTDETAFTGFDAYKKVLDSGCQMVILATPPGFRPMHFKAAIEAGKHVFFEKPVATDPTGVRTVLEYGKIAKEKKLAVVTGTQRRHEKCYLDAFQRIKDGAIGDVVAGRAYWNSGGVWVNPRREGQSDMEYQLKNWYYFPWLCGDHIVEQHVHNLDVMQWAMGANPVKATAVGGRQVRVEPQFGVIYDHFGVDYEYPNDVHVMSMCRHWPVRADNVSEALQGTKGRAYLSSGRCSIEGAAAWKSGPNPKNPYVQEHTDLIESIRKGEPLNEAERIAHSTLVAIMGREAAYTGKVITWDQILNSPQNLMPEKLEFGPLPEPKVPIPGKNA
jgi:predicted dehydrogenase